MGIDLQSQSIEMNPSCGKILHIIVCVLLLRKAHFFLLHLRYKFEFVNTTHGGRRAGILDKRRLCMYVNFVLLCPRCISRMFCMRAACNNTNDEPEQQQYTMPPANHNENRDRTTPHSPPPSLSPLSTAYKHTHLLGYGIYL